MPNDMIWIDGEQREMTDEEQAAFDAQRAIDSAPKPITADDVWAEKDRRLALGFDYDFGDARGVHHISTTKTDMEGWKEVSDWAATKTELDQPDATTVIFTETGPVTITPHEWYLILDAGGMARQAIWGSSFALVAQDPIPTDYAEDQYWS